MASRQRGLAAGLAIGLGMLGGASILLNAESQSQSITTRQLARNLGQLPLRFERNDGQFDAGTRFAARGLRYGLALRATDAVISLQSGDGQTAAALRMSLLGAHPASTVTGLDQQPGVINQIRGNDRSRWHLNIPSFARVRYAGVYDGIDLVYHGNEQQLEYDFELAPGADPHTIALHFDGVTRVARDEATGDLLLHVGAAEPMRQHAPIAYQQIDGVRRPVDSRYAVRADGTVGFEVGAYDRAAPLTIDPVILYSTVFGGQSEEDLHDVALDPAGNIYITGRIQDAQGFPTASPMQPARSGPSDAFVSKFNPSGTALIYSTYLGGSGDENFRGLHSGRIATDASGNAYVAGDTNSPDFPITPATAYDPSYADNTAHPTDAFYVKLSPTGTLLYGTYIGGTAYEYVMGIKVDSTGNVYVAGVTNSTNVTFPMTASAYQANNAGDNDIFLIKFDVNGARLYSTYLGRLGSENDGGEGGGLAIDDAGMAYVAGDTDSTTFPIVNGAQTTYGGSAHDAFLAKFDTTKSGVASLVYSTYLGGSGNEITHSLAYAGNGQVVIAGQAGSGFPVKNAVQAAFKGGGFDCYVAKIDTTLTGPSSLLFATYLGGAANEVIYGVAVDTAGTIHVVGTSQSTDFPLVDALSTSVFLSQPFVARINSTGSTLVFSSFWGGTSNGQSLNAVATNSRGDTFIAGQTNNQSVNPPNQFGTPLVNPFQNAYGGGDADVMLARIGNPVPPDDSDEDGLPNDWETKFGLNPNDPSGDNGPNGDPDHDGFTNAQELANGTHPRGFVITYLAEGATGSFFSTRLALANPTDTTALTLIRFQRADAVTIPVYVTIAPHARYTLDVETVPGLESADFSTLVEADQQIVADRTMTWDKTGYGSHAERGILTRTATTWYLAEGATHGGFSLFYLIQNPGPTPLNLQISYLLPAPLPPIVLNYVVAPTSRRTIPVDDEPGLSATDVSAILQSTNGVPFIAERSMYFSRIDQAFAAGHESAGVTSTSTHWFLAEGATGAFFNMFVLLANPNSTDANVEMQYLLEDGSIVTKTHLVAAQSRLTLNAALEDPRLTSANFSTVANSTNGVGIIVERSMWWPANNPGGWYEAHNSPGETTTGTKWAMAEGETGGSVNKQTYILIANTSSFVGQASVTLLYEDGTTDVKTFNLPASGRMTVNVGVEFPSSVGKRYGAVVQTLGATPAQVVVERAMYSDAGGVIWAAGTDALATKLQ